MSRGLQLAYRPLAREDPIVSESDLLLFARRIPARLAAPPLARGVISNPAPRRSRANPIGKVRPGIER